MSRRRHIVSSMKRKASYQQHLETSKTVTAFDVANFKSLSADVQHDVIFSLHESIERMTRNTPSDGYAMLAPFMAILVALGSFAIAANFALDGLLLFWLAFGVVAVSIILLRLLTVTSMIA